MRNFLNWVAYRELELVALALFGGYLYLLWIIVGMLEAIK